MKILVTGGSGFVGRSLIKKLNEKKKDIFNIDLSSNEYKVNLLNFSELKKTIKDINPDYIYHLAAFNNNPRSIESPKECLEMNINGTINILECCKEISCRGVIVPSTYYLNQKNETFDSPYILSKYFQEQLVKHYRDLYQVPAAIIRMANVYGYNKANDTFIQSVARKMIEDKNKISVGNLDQERDFIHVEDVAEALSLFSEKENFPAGDFFLGNGKPVSLSEALKSIAQIVGFHGEVVQNKNEIKGNDQKSLSGNPEKLFKVLGWSPKISIGDGLKKTLSEIQNENRGK